MKRATSSRRQQSAAQPDDGRDDRGQLTSNTAEPQPEVDGQGASQPAAPAPLPSPPALQAIIPTPRAQLRVAAEEPPSPSPQPGRRRRRSTDQALPPSPTPARRRLSTSTPRADPADATLPAPARSAVLPTLRRSPRRHPPARPSSSGCAAELGSSSRSASSSRSQVAGPSRPSTRQVRRAPPARRVVTGLRSSNMNRGSSNSAWSAGESSSSSAMLRLSSNASTLSGNSSWASNSAESGPSSSRGLMQHRRPLQEIPLWMANSRGEMIRRRSAMDALSLTGRNGSNRESPIDGSASMRTSPSRQPDAASEELAANLRARPFIPAELHAPADIAQAQPPRISPTAEQDGQLERSFDSITSLPGLSYTPDTSIEAEAGPSRLPATPPNGRSLLQRTLVLRSGGREAAAGPSSAAAKADAMDVGSDDELGDEANKENTPSPRHAALFGPGHAFSASASPHTPGNASGSGSAIPSPRAGSAGGIGSAGRARSRSRSLVLSPRRRVTDETGPTAPARKRRQTDDADAQGELDEPLVPQDRWPPPPL